MNNIAGALYRVIKIKKNDTMQFVLSYVWICAVYKNNHICISFKSLFTRGNTGMPNVTTNNSL